VIGALIFGLFLKFSIGGVKRVIKFVMIYDDPDAPKHSRKSMMLSIIPYFIILFLLCVFSTFGPLVFFVVLPAWLFTFFFLYHYLRVWKYHGYSVLLLIFLSLLWLSGCFAVSPFAKQAMTAAVDFVRSLL
jgi:hypothetical protein